MVSIHSYLSQPETYIELFDQYYAKLAQSYYFDEQHVIHQIDKVQLADDIAAEISDETFTFETPKQRRLIISSRKKKLYTFNTKDLLVLKALHATLQPLVNKHCSKKLYSYLKQRNFKQAINHFLEYRKKNE